MRGRLIKLSVALVVLAALAGGGAAWATTRGGGEQPLTGSTLDRATSAALSQTGGGRVTETEAGDDGAAYSVEVRLDDGSQVEISLDASFKVIGREAEGDNQGERSGAGGE